jgi:hypothetical protein
MRGFQGRRNRGYTRNLTPHLELTDSEKKELRAAAQKAVEETREEIRKFNAMKTGAANNGINLGGSQ